MADSAVTKIYLGRPWRAFAKTAFIRCTLPKEIAPEGWDNWGNSENEKTVLYAEYKNLGPGAIASKRAPWTRQLTDKEAKEFTLEQIFANTSFQQETNWFQQVSTKLFEWPVKK